MNKLTRISRLEKSLVLKEPHVIFISLNESFDSAIKRYEKQSHRIVNMDDRCKLFILTRGESNVTQIETG